jgi:5-hydroxyisourate hydrolase-like protein (transthyretin family)
MNPITFPLKLRMKRPEVGDLQDALQQCLERCAILATDEGARKELSETLKRERTALHYGKTTHKLVSIFQEEQRLESSGEVDEPTAKALNKLLHKWGMLDRQTKPRFHIVSGEVRREDGLPVQGVRVRAAHEIKRRSIRLGEDTTDNEGRYTIRYELLPGIDSINLRVSAIDENGKPLKSSDLVRNAKALESIDLITPIAGKPQKQWQITGNILLEHGLPAENIALRLYRHDFGGKTTKWGETTTLAGGQYAFTFDPGGKAASLEVRAVKGNKEIPLSKPLDDLGGESSTVLNLLAPLDLQPLASEYGRLTNDLKPHVGQIKKLAEAKENSKRQDLTVLNRATGWDARLIALAATTERLRADADVKLSSEAR